MAYHEESEEIEEDLPPSPTSSVCSLWTSNFNSKLEGKDSRDKLADKTPVQKNTTRQREKMLEDDLNIKERKRRYD